MTETTSPEGVIYIVRLVHGEQVIRSIEVTTTTFTIGSDPRCTVRLAGDPSISPVHATVYLDDGAPLLVPSAGAPVLLNGDPVDMVVPSPEDLLQVGRMRFRIELAGAGRPAAPPEPVPPAPPDESWGNEESEEAVDDDEEFDSLLAEMESVFEEDDEDDDEIEVEEPIVVEPPPVAPPAPAVAPPPAPPQEAAAPRETAPPVADEPPADAAPAPWMDAATYFGDDDEEDEATFVEPFDLAQQLLVPPRQQAEGPKESYCAAHVVRVVQGRVLETVGVHPGTDYRSPGGAVKCSIAGEQLQLTLQATVTGVAVQGEQSAQLGATDGGAQTLVLRDGDSAQLSESGAFYRVLVYRPPRAPRSLRLGISPLFVLLILVALLSHMVVGVALALVGPGKIQSETADEDEVFAMVDMEAPNDLDKPDKPKPPPPDATAMAERAPTVTNKTVTQVQQQPKSADVNSVLNTLAHGSGNTGETRPLAEQVGNVDRAAANGNGSFGLSDRLAALPGNSVTVKRGDGSINTQAGEQVANPELTSIGEGRKGEVKGKVTKMSSEAKVEGSLSRSEVTRVVNSHIHEIQACYERSLINNPDISGRIVFDWTVTPEGGVTGVRVRSSTLGSSEVASCISALIKKWKFTQPEGGEVTVTYPFLFRSVSQ